MTRRALTLVELLVTLTLIGMASVVAAVNLRGFGDEAELRAAASQLGLFCRTAALQASTTGMPRRLTCDQRWCSAAAPHYVEGEWHWHDGPRMNLPRKIAVRAASIQGAVTERQSPEPPWQLYIPPDGLTVPYEFRLVRGAMCAIVSIDVHGEELRWCEE